MGRKHVRNRIKNNIEMGIVVLFSLLFVSLAFNNNAWDDEIYSMRWTAFSWADMFESLIKDVHPPLYYIMLKIVNMISGNNLIIAKLFSTFAVVLILAIGAKFIKKEVGQKSSIFFLFFFSFTPIIMAKSVEVRMYTWTMLFVLLAGIFAYYLMKHPTRKSWIGFLISALLAAYTHYYGVAAMIFMYASLLLYFIVLKKKKEILTFFGICLLTVVGYLPWLFYGIKQITQVNSDYWIEKPSSRLKLVRDLFETKIPFAQNLLLLLCVISVIAFLVLLCYKKEFPYYWGLSMCLSFWGILVAGMMYGEFIRPIIVSRYLIIPFAAMALGMSILWKYVPKVILSCFIVGMLVIGIYQYQLVFQEEYHTLTEQTVEFYEEHMEDGDLIVWDVSSLNNAILYYLPKTSPHSYSNFDIYEEEYEQIWFFQFYDNTIDFKRLEELNITYETYGKYSLDNVYFTLYSFRRES